MLDQSSSHLKGTAMYLHRRAAALALLTGLCLGAVASPSFAAEHTLAPNGAPGVAATNSVQVPKLLRDGISITNKSGQLLTSPVFQDLGGNAEMESLPPDAIKPGDSGSLVVSIPSSASSHYRVTFDLAGEPGKHLSLSISRDGSPWGPAVYGEVTDAAGHHDSSHFVANSYDEGPDYGDDGIAQVDFTVN